MRIFVHYDDRNNVLVIQNAYGIHANSDFTFCSL